MQDIQYNDIRGSSLQIFARELISIPAAQPNMEEVNYQGGMEPYTSLMAHMQQHQ